MALSEIEQRRFSSYLKSEKIGIKGMEALKGSKILMVGLGSVGIPAALYLLSSGVGKLGICDYQTISENDFYKQTIFGTGDLGKLKTIVLKERLAQSHPNAEITIHNIELTKENLGKLAAGYDIIINSTNVQDNDILFAEMPESKIVLNAYCKGFSAFVWSGSLNSSFKTEIKDTEKTTDFSFVVGPMAGITGSTVANVLFKHLTGIETILPNLQIKL
jgi:adenylyltransferase/sulfurtransferase